MPDLPSGTVSFLFTDIEQSTRAWEDHTATMEAALTRHDALCRSLIEAGGGYVFSASGDGFCAAFGHARQAAAAAVAIQRALATEAWPEGLRLEVRMGVHSGDAQERDANYYGPTVNRAARIMDAAHGGQILVSDAAASSLSGEDLIDLGLHWLKDLPTRERLWHLVTDPERRFAPPRTMGSGGATNLQASDDALVGRDEDRDALTELLAANRLVSIVGVGGIGKTRLAADVARAALASFADGVWWCELAPLGEEEAVAAAVASTLGARQHPGRTMVDSVAEFCARRELLLVLDNCEHVLNAAGDLAEAVLARAPGVKVLTTSREALGCRGEQAWPIRSLALDGEDSAACELFLRRAAQMTPNRAWSGEDRAAIARICRRMDGMPLAIELAAGRVRSLSPVEIEERLDSAFQILRGGRRRLERHRTLEAAIDWSYQMLEEASVLVFERLAVFAGGLDLAAAEAVCADDDVVDTLDVADILDDLVTKSLVVAEPRPHRTTRYRLLEPLRQYAENRLAARGSALATRDAHADYYCCWAERQAAGRCADELAWRQALEAEFANLRAAVAWAVDAGDVDRALRTVVALDAAQGPFLMLEVGDWARAAVALEGAVDHRLGPDACRTAANSAWWRGDLATMAAMVERADSMPHCSPTALHTNQIKAMLLAASGDIEGAVAWIDRVELETADSMNATVPWWRCALLPEPRAEDLETLHRIERETGSEIVGIMVDQSEASFALAHGNHAEAAARTRSAIARARKLGSWYFVHLSLCTLGLSAGKLGELTDEDLAEVRDALRMQRDCGAEVDQWLVLVPAAFALLHGGKEELARAIASGLLASPWKGSTMAEGVCVEVFGATHRESWPVAGDVDLGGLVERVLGELGGG
jgi:predicted ATPase/class 3 adenylate cyclase